MKAIAPLFRHFSTAKESPALISSVGFSTGDPTPARQIIGRLLDQYPDSVTLRKLYANFIVNDHFLGDAALGIKFMRAYAACGDPAMARCIFDQVPDKNVVFCNVMIRSYVNNRLYHDALLLFKTLNATRFGPDNYTYPCVLKACSGSDNLGVGLQIHAAVVKVGLSGNLFIGNGLIAMYGKCGCLVEARLVFDEMPCRDVVSCNSMVAGYAQNGRFDDAIDVFRKMKTLGLKADAGTMASLFPAVTNSSFGECFVY